IDLEIAIGNQGPRKRDPKSGNSLSGLLDEHPPAHLHMEGMTEPVAVVPVNPWLTCRKGHGSGLLRTDLHAHTMVYHTETVGHILNHIQVGDIHRYLVTFLHLEFGHTVLRRNGGHVNTHLVAVTDH